jgi:glutathione S-transferase
MKFYYHPASTTSRAVLLFLDEQGIGFQPKVVDLFTGEHLSANYAEANPNRLVPMLEDGDFRLTECAAILKYLADLTASPEYPGELRLRARVNERMDWFNTQLARDFAYGFVYPQIFPGHKREIPLVQQSTLQWHRDKARQWLNVLDRHIIGPDHDYVCGERITIADYHGVALVALGEIARLDYAPYPNVRRWLGRMKALPSWARVYEAIDGYAASLTSMSFEPLERVEA